MRILVTGADGQVGWELLRSCQPLGEVVAMTRQGLDLSRVEDLRPTLVRCRPDVIVNAAAYTAVKSAETNEAAATLINGDAVGELAGIAAELGALLVHYSTDYVFDGRGPAPYREVDAPNPLNAYGRSKRRGEEALAASDAAYLCLRTSWVFGPRAENFLRTMLRLASRKELSVVDDNLGAPTSARLIADATAMAIRDAVRASDAGTFEPELLHLTASGETSSFGFAEAIFRIWASMGTRGGETPRLLPIRNQDYDTGLDRPLNSRLDCSRFCERFGMVMPHWEAGVALALKQIDDAARN